MADDSKAYLVFWQSSSKQRLASTRYQERQVVSKQDQGLSRRVQKVNWCGLNRSAVSIYAELRVDVDHRKGIHSIQ